MNNSGNFLDFDASYYLDDQSAVNSTGYWAHSFYGNTVQVGSTFPLRGLAVRDGDVLVVSEPGVVALLALGFSFLVFARRRTSA